jgi:type I restriction enzyme S subunit
MGSEQEFTPSEWQTTTLGEIADAGGAVIQTGPFGSQLHSYDYEPAGVPVVPTEAIDQRWIKTEALPRISPEKAEELKRHRLQAGDILFARRGVQATGTSAIVRSDQAGWLCGTGAILFRLIGAETCPQFLSFLLSARTSIEWLKSNAVGAVMPNLNESIIRRFPLLLPPIGEQRGIANVLAALDDKIHLNRQMNVTLEAIAQALFQAWFVDFEPLRAKEQGWRLEKLGDVAAINARSIRGEYPHASIEYIDISAVTEGRLEGTTPYRMHEAPSRAQRLVQHGDTIWSCVRPNRQSYLFMHEPPANFVVSTGFAVLSPEKVTPSFLHAWVTTDEFVEYLTNNADGSAYPAVRARDFARAEILVPDAATMKRFEEVVMPMRELIAKNQWESATLAALRDLLLPRLMSGEIRLKMTGHPGKASEDSRC